MVKRYKPLCVMGSPPCTMYCQLQNLNPRKDSEEWNARREEADTFMKFMCQVYEEQVKNGRYFIHEHPAGASSWQLECIQSLGNMNEVGFVTLDMCAYGLVSYGEEGV